jgi:ADP-ribose pyrophosphatase YjhB (NUDIX family)
MKTRQAVGAFILRDNQILLVKKQKVESDVAQFQPHWDIPKGGIKSGESFSDALGRELREELAVSSNDIDEMACMVETIDFEFPPGSEFDAQKTTIFRVKLKGKVDLEIASSEIGDLKWIAPSKALDLLPRNETRDYLKQNIQELR